MPADYEMPHQLASLLSKCQRHFDANNIEEATNIHMLKLFIRKVNQGGPLSKDELGFINKIDQALESKIRSDVYTAKRMRRL